VTSFFNYPHYYLNNPLPPPPPPPHKKKRKKKKKKERGVSFIEMDDFMEHYPKKGIFVKRSDLF
jgi:hypothetical protein